jgi:hypothetical protein
METTTADAFGGKNAVRKKMSKLKVQKNSKWQMPKIILRQAQDGVALKTIMYEQAMVRLRRELSRTPGEP